MKMLVFLAAACIGLAMDGATFCCSSLILTTQALAGEGRTTQTAAGQKDVKRLLEGRGITRESLEFEYNAIVREREALAASHKHIGTGDQARQYVRQAEQLRKKIRDYEAKRGAYNAAFGVTPDSPKRLEP